MQPDDTEKAPTMKQTLFSYGNSLNQIQIYK